jgi:hypothetical protein
MKTIVFHAALTQVYKETTATFFRSLVVIVIVVLMSAMIVTWKVVIQRPCRLLRHLLYPLFAVTLLSNAHIAVSRTTKKTAHLAVLTLACKETTATFFRSLAVIVTVVRMSALIATWKDVNPVHYLLLNQRLFRLQSQLFAATSLSNAHIAV